MSGDVGEMSLRNACVDFRSHLRGKETPGGKKGVIPAEDDSTIPRCGSGWCQLAFSPRFFEERFEMQPVFSSYRSSRALLGIFLFFSFVGNARRVPFPKNGFSPAFKNRNKFLFFFFPFLSLLAPFSWLAEKHRDNA